MLESWKVESWKVGKFGSWKVRSESWKVGKLGLTSLEIWKVEPKNMGHKLESQHLKLNISSSNNISTHDEDLNYSSIMLLYILSLIGVLIVKQQYS